MPWLPVSTGSQPSSPSSGGRRKRASRQNQHESRQEPKEDTDELLPSHATELSDTPCGQQPLNSPREVAPPQKEECTWADLPLDASDSENIGCEAWPRTPSSRSRSPSPCPVLAPQFVMAAVPMAFASHPMMPPTFGFSTGQWIAEVRGMAAKMQMLALAAPPSLDDCVCHSATMTDTSMDHVDCWEAAAIYLCNIQAEAAAFEQKAAIAESAANSIEVDYCKVKAELQAVICQLSAKAAVQFEKHCVAAAALAAAQEVVTKSMDALAATKNAIAIRAIVSSECVASLRLDVAAQVASHKEAEEKVALLRSEQVLAKDLPTLRSRQEAAELRVAQLTRECTQMRQQAEALRMEMDSVVQGGSGTRAETLESVVGQLESECRELQQSDGVDAGIGADLGEENRRLLVEVREARAARDEAQAQVSTLTLEVKALKVEEVALVDMNAHIRSETEHHELLKEEMQARRAHIAKLEQKAQEIDGAMKVLRQKKRGADKGLEALEIARRKNKTECEMLDWKFQELKKKLDKSKDPLCRCLMRTGFPERTIKSKLRPREQTDGSDVGSESIDAEVSTNCGESSVMDALLD